MQLEENSSEEQLTPGKSLPIELPPLAATGENRDFTL